MEQIQQTSSIPHLVQVYQPSASSTKIQSPQIIHITHASLPTSQGKLTYQQAITSESIQIPVTSQHVEIQMSQNQIVMSCPQGMQSLPLQCPPHVVQSADMGQALPIGSHVILPQHMLVNGVQSYYGQFEYPKEHIVMASTEAVKKDVDVGQTSTNQNTILTQENQPKKRSRSQVPDPRKWACNVRKLKHQRGEAYISRRGKYVPERKIKAKDCNCRFNCNEKISDTDREHIFKSFYSLNVIEKKYFLLNTTERFSIKQHKVVYGSKRKYSFKYFFRIKSEKYVVCKNFYLGTLAISQKPIYNVHMGKSDLDMPKQDGRGHSVASTHSIPEDAKDRVRTHIMSFKTLESKSILHYSKKKQYLESNFSIKQMYNMYVECNKDSVIPVKESMYRKIFKLEFNVHFKKTKTVPPLCVRCKGDIKNEASINE